MSEQPEATPWPNQQPVVDGVTPYADVPQDPDAFPLDEEDDQ